MITLLWEDARSAFLPSIFICGWGSIPITRSFLLHGKSLNMRLPAFFSHRIRWYALVRSTARVPRQSPEPVLPLISFRNCKSGRCWHGYRQKTAGDYLMKKKILTWMLIFRQRVFKEVHLTFFAVRQNLFWPCMEYDHADAMFRLMVSLCR